MMYELNGAELDAVAGGQQALGQAGLVNVGLISEIGDIDVNVVRDSVNNNRIDITALNGNQIQVGAGVALAILGGAAAGVAQRLA
ncbi:MAG: hypothetical protein K0S06_1081 [Microvirga sp.]|jgi:hypothetical protein|nr:hypothetical protein [Microvirga sp.]